MNMTMMAIQTKELTNLANIVRQRMTGTWLPDDEKSRPLFLGKVLDQRSTKTGNGALVKGRTEPRMAKGIDDENLQKAVWLLG
jgi:hypothetical protein